MNKLNIMPTPTFVITQTPTPHLTTIIVSECNENMFYCIHIISGQYIAPIKFEYRNNKPIIISSPGVIEASQIVI